MREFATKELSKKIYDRMFSNLDHTIFRCDLCDDKWQPTGETSPDVTHDCARAPCPGSEIILCPSFGKAGCPGGPTILHEAAHNAGACDDIQQGSANYPPGNAENNAYSYENFAVEFDSGLKKP
jgi:hypothetical protein